MKLKWVIFAAARITMVVAVVIATANQRFNVAMMLQDNGLKSLKIRDVEFLENGEFRVEQVVLRRPDGQIYQGAKLGSSMVDPARDEVTKILPWGILKVNYAASGNRLALTMTVANTSNSETIQGLQLEPFILRFPNKVTEYDGTIPLLAHNVGDLALVKVSYGSGALAVLSEDLDKPLMVGFPWALDRPNNMIFPLSVHTDRVNTYPDSYPTLKRPIPPKGTDVYRVSLRFGRPDATADELAGDVFKKYGETFPAKLKWTDHRPIGAIFLATASQDFDTNPQGWFGDSHVNVKTASGRAEFRQRVLALADTAVAVMRSMNAQGAITWDIEGQRYGHAVGYICDPRIVNDLAPEMNEIADEYFARIRDAGFRVGVCIRPQQVTVSPDRKTVTQTAVADPAQLLIDKIGYVKKRWNATLIYIDSNADPRTSIPMDPDVIEKVSAAFPDVLLIPEHRTLRYYAYSAPYAELRNGDLGTSDAVRAVYPNAFSLIYTADGNLDLFKTKLTREAKLGSAFMYRTWYPDPQNQKVRALMDN